METAETQMCLFSNDNSKEPQLSDLLSSSSKKPDGKQKPNSETVRRNIRGENKMRICNTVRIEMAYLLGSEASLSAVVERDDAEKILGSAKYYASKGELKNIRQFLRSLYASMTCNVCPHSRKCGIRYDYRERERTANQIYGKISATGLDTWRKELEKDLAKNTCRTCDEIRSEVHNKIKERGE